MADTPKLPARLHRRQGCDRCAHVPAGRCAPAVSERDTVPVRHWYRDRGWDELRVEVPIQYLIETSAGEQFSVELYAETQSESYDRFLLPIMAALIVVGAAYLILGLFVWKLRPDRAESWAFLLFTATIATQLFGSFHTYDAIWGYQRMAS